MDIEKLQALVIDALEDVKAADIALFDTGNLTSLFERIVIASGNSNRQTKALAASVRDKVKEAGGDIISIEGEDTGEWVLVDLGDIIVHIMQPAIRNYYRLEEIWGENPMDIEAAKNPVTPKKKTVRKTASKAKPATAAKTAESEPAAKPVRRRTKKAAEEKPAEG